MKFNEKLKQLRLEKNYTQDDVAVKLNISRQSVSKWEIGINEPDIDTLKKLCIIFDCSIADLIDDDKEIDSTKDNKLNRLIYANIVVVIFSFLTILSFIFVINNNVLINIRFDGIRNYGSKWSYLALLILPLIMLIVSLVIKKSNNKNKMIRRNNYISLIVILFINIILTISLIILFYLIDNYNESKISASVTLLALSLITSLSIFTHPKINQYGNSLFGFRTEFTLSNEEAWNELNRVGSIVMFSISLFTFLLNLILLSLFENYGVYSVYSISLIILSIIPLMIYHSVLKRKITKKQ